MKVHYCILTSLVSLLITITYRTSVCRGQLWRKSVIPLSFLPSSQVQTSPVSLSLIKCVSIAIGSGWAKAAWISAGKCYISDYVTTPSLIDTDLITRDCWIHKDDPLPCFNSPSSYLSHGSIIAEAGSCHLFQCNNSVLTGPVYADSCATLKASNQLTNKVYQICPYPSDRTIVVHVLCYITQPGYGGWTMIQRRDMTAPITQNFNSTWNDYKNGFSKNTLMTQYWIGFKLIRALLAQVPTMTLGIFLKTWDGAASMEEYSSFNVGDEASGYVLSVSGPSGNAGDSLTFSNGMKFSTRDNDSSAWSCATTHSGGWWYQSDLAKEDCYEGNLNGFGYGDGNDTGGVGGIVWKAGMGMNYSYQLVMMLLRPTP